MKGLKKILAVLLTVLVLFIGFWLPELVLQHQDSELETQVYQYELNDVKLDLSNRLLEKISIICKEYQTLDVQVEGETQMTEVEVFQEMLTVEKLLDRFLMVDEEILDWYVEPELVVGTGSSFSFIVWFCSIEYENREVIMKIDDASGKMLAFASVFYRKNDTDTVVSVQMQEEELDALCEKLKDYYELSEVSFGGSVTDAQALGYAEYGNSFWFDIILIDGNGDEVDMPYRIDEDGNCFLNEFF